MTFPHLLLQQVQVRAQHPAFREKDRGIWQTWSWQQTLEQVQWLACGLAQQGFKRGMQLAIVGDNRPRLYWAMMAAQAIGGVPVPLYQESPASDMAFVMQDAQIRFAIVEDQEQVDKMLAIQQEYPDLAFIAWDKERGMRHYQGAGLMSCQQLQDQGREYAKAHPNFFQQELDKGLPDDVAIILYTSGTTSKPKGVCQTHRALIAAAKGGVQFDKLTERENILSYLPMAWAGDCLFSFAQAHVAGFTVNCPESGETVMTDMREIGPTFYFAPPRVFENMRTSLMIRMEDASQIKRAVFDYFMAHAARVGNAILDRKPVALVDRLKYWLGDLIIFAPLKNVLGLSQVRVAYTAGAAIGPDLFRFYRSIGINLKQLYGATETCGYVCLQPDNNIKFDSVGPPAPGVEVRLSEQGEVLVRSLSILKQYYGRPEATREVIDAEGWFHTGDAGVFDSDGHLRIIDRAADVGQLNGGAIFAPNYIENKLKFIPFVKEAVSFGHQKDAVCAFINIDSSLVGNWAEKRGIAWAGYAELATHPEVGKMIAGHIEQMNQVLASEPGMAATQIKRFLVLHKELDPDDEELTRTRKVRRKFIAEKYAVLIDALYSDLRSQFIEIQVKYEDGRTGSISADLTIHDLATGSGGKA